MVLLRRFAVGVIGREIRRFARGAGRQNPLPGFKVANRASFAIQKDPGWLPGVYVLDPTPMTKTDFAFWMTSLGTACWAVCFWWMYRISEKQNNLLDRLSDQGKRIEKLSRIEHDLIKEVHPKVSDIKDGMEEVIAAVKENTESNVSTSSKPTKG